MGKAQPFYNIFRRGRASPHTTGGEAVQYSAVLHLAGAETEHYFSSTLRKVIE